MFPTKPGLYVITTTTKTIMARITGFHPFLEVKDGYVISDYMATGKIRPIDEGEKFLIKQKPDDCVFSTFLLEENVTTNSLIKNTAKVGLTELERIWFNETYVDCKKAGCSDHSLISMAKSEFGLSLEQAISLLNEMEKMANKQRW